MKIKEGYNKGVEITLTGNEVARAIMAYIVAHGVYISGPKTIRVNKGLCEEGSIYVDPSGYVITKKGKKVKY